MAKKPNSTRSTAAKTAAKKPATKKAAPAKAAAAKPAKKAAPAKKVTAKKPVAAKKAAAKKPAAAKKKAAKKVAAKKPAAKKPMAAKKVVAQKAAAKKPVVAKKTAAKKAAAKKASAKQPVAKAAKKSAPAKKPVAKKARAKAAAPQAAAAPAPERQHVDRSQPETLRLRNPMPSLTANDVAASLRFYVEGLGFTVKERWEKNGELQGAMLIAGDFEMGLGQDDWGKGRDRVKGLGFSLYFDTVQDLEAIATRARENGIEVDGPKDSQWNSRLLGVTDPDGFKLWFQRNNDKE